MAKDTVQELARIWSQAPQCSPTGSVKASSVGVKESPSETWELTLEGGTVIAANHMCGRTIDLYDRHR